MANTTNSAIPYLSLNDAALFLLPTRGEKRIIPSPLANTPRSKTSPGIQPQDLTRTAAWKDSQHYVTVRLPGRGLTAQGAPDTTVSAVFQFLIDPAQVAITRQHLDASALARAGWQIGVWGEDFVQITMEGNTPGRYFADGLTDEYAALSLSYRNLTALELLVENNGYWYEGEQAAEGPLAAGYTRRQIKMHSDVELSVGEFIWWGMFESLNIREDANTPFIQPFTLVFTAWRERFHQGTPYLNPIGGSVERGHIPAISLAYGGTNAAAGAVSILNGQGTATPSASVAAAAVPLPPYISAQSAGLPADLGPTANLPTVDATPMDSILSPNPDTWSTGPIA